MKDKLKIYKITKTWYIYAKSIIELKKDKLSTVRKDSDETKITQVREW